MASRKEEKERLRQERIEAERRASSGQRRKLLIGYIVAGVLAAAVVIGIVIAVTSSGGSAAGEAHILAVSGDTNGLTPDERDGTAPPEQQEFDLAKAAKAASCTLREDLKEEGRTHLGQDEDPPEYKTDPPTSGDHVEPPFQQADGAYLEMPEPKNFVHSMEHGRILLQYNPDLPEAEQLELRGMYDEMYAGALFFPNPEMPYDVAVTAWQNLLGCDSYEGAATLDAIRAFGIEKFGSEGPEDVFAFGPLEGPTPATPGDSGS